MLSAFLFGESCTVLERKDDWLFVRQDFDRQEGWVPDYYLYPDKTNNTDFVVKNKNARIVLDDGEILLSPGSCVPAELHRIGPSRIHNLELPETAEDEAALQSMHAYAKYHFLNTPYLWGGRSIWGLDCSGMTSVICKIFGIDLPRNAAQQAEHGTEIAYGEHKPDDLVFFKNPAGKITHVGIVMQNGKIIHASGRVRIDELTAEGIIQSESGKLTHLFATIKRFY
jgi:hypothetical protein